MTEEDHVAFDSPAPPSLPGLILSPYVSKGESVADELKRTPAFRGAVEVHRSADCWAHGFAPSFTLIVPAPSDFLDDSTETSDGAYHLLNQSKIRWPNNKPSVLLFRDFPTLAINLLRRGASDVFQMWQLGDDREFRLAPPPEEFGRLLANIAAQRGAPPIYSLITKPLHRDFLPRSASEKWWQLIADADWRQLRTERNAIYAVLQHFQVPYKSIQSTQRNMLGDPPRFGGLVHIESEIDLLMYLHRARASVTGYDSKLLPLRLEKLSMPVYYLVASGQKLDYLPPARTLSYGCSTALAVRLFYLFPPSR